MEEIKTQMGAATTLLSGGDGFWWRGTGYKPLSLRFDLREHFKSAVELSKLLGIDGPESDDLEDLLKFERKAAPLLEKKRLENMQGPLLPSSQGI